MTRRPEQLQLLGNTRKGCPRTKLTYRQEGENERREKARLRN